MKTLKIKIPDYVELNDKDALMALASKLYETGKLSLGHAAELAGLSKRAFMEILVFYDVSIFNYSPEDLDKDLKYAESYNL